MERLENNHWEEQMHHIPGGKALLSQHNAAKAILPTVAYMVPDEA
jgi:hypothetical protein